MAPGAGARVIVVVVVVVEGTRWMVRGRVWVVLAEGEGEREGEGEWAGEVGGAKSADETGRRLWRGRR